LDSIFSAREFPELYSDVFHKVNINYYPPRGDNKEGWDNVDIFGWLGYPMQIKINFLCRDSILAAPLVLDIALFLDRAKRDGRKGVQDWLAFYFKSPLSQIGRSLSHDPSEQFQTLEKTLKEFADLRSA
jgi:myo-inositol-1-phosphate synthase